MNEEPAQAYQVIYLTGAPATGKSSVALRIAQLLAPLSVFEYGAELTRFLRERGANVTQDHLRGQSARIATPEDIEELDGRLIEFVNQRRTRGHVLIDSHAVTKEAGGFRVTPFSMAQIAAVAPTCIVILYAPADIIRARIAEDAGGRQVVTPWEADYHGQLQAAVAIVYAISLGVPAFAIDASQSVDAVSNEVVRLVMSASNRSARGG